MKVDSNRVSAILRRARTAAARRDTDDMIGVVASDVPDLCDDLLKTRDALAVAVAWADAFKTHRMDGQNPIYKMACEHVATRDALQRLVDAAEAIEKHPRPLGDDRVCQEYDEALSGAKLVLESLPEKMPLLEPIAS